MELELKGESIYLPCDKEYSVSTGEVCGSEQQKISVLLREKKSLLSNRVPVQVSSFKPSIILNVCCISSQVP